MEQRTLHSRPTKRLYHCPARYEFLLCCSLIPVIVDYSSQTTDIAESILHRKVHVPAETKDSGKVLSHRYLWNENGLGLEDVQYTESNCIAFAGVACLLLRFRETHAYGRRSFLGA
jgi:hypothetical protein